MAIIYKTSFYRYKRYFLRAKKIYQQPIAKASLTLILTLLTISLLSLFALKPTFITIAKLTKELKDMQKVNQTLEKKITQLNQAQTNYKKIKDDLVYLNRSLPTKANFNHLNSKIAFLAFNHNLIIPSASFGKFELVMPKKNEETTLKFKITVAGDFTKVKNFLKDLENLDRIIKIDTVSFSTKTNVPKAQIQTQITAEAFYLFSLNQEENEEKTFQ